MTHTLIKVENLSIERAFDGHFLLENIQFSLNQGECVALVGESGSGKSLTALSLVDLLPSGMSITKQSTIMWQEHIQLTAIKPSDWHAFRGRNIGMVFQDPLHALNPVLTIGYQLIQLLRKHNPTLGAMDLELEAIRRFDEVELSGGKLLLAKYPCELSGGQQQRVMIALAMSARPELLIADEPTTALDTVTRRHLLDLLERLRKERKSGLLLISHDLRLVESRADRVIVLEKGTVKENATAVELFQRPQHPYTRKLLDARPFIQDVLSKRPCLTGSNNEIKDSLLALDKVMKRQGDFILQPISLSLSQGQSLAIMGGSGSGKSTIARLMMGLITPDSGSVYFQGQSTSTLSAVQKQLKRQYIQMIFQNPYASLNPAWTVEQILREPLILLGLSQSKERDRQRLQAVLNDVELDASLATLARRPVAFSGGQRQRLALARALLLEPKLLICDEATSALDVSIQAEIIKLLERLRTDRGIGLLIIAHDLAMIAALADEVMVMYQGCVIERDVVQRVLSHPQHAMTQMLCEAA